MGGIQCPACHRLTYFPTSAGRQCKTCGYGSFNRIPPNKGRICYCCQKRIPFGTKCLNCGTVNTKAETD